MKRVCVYCGSNPGANAAYTIAARGLGALLAHLGVAVVFGGGRVGLMGEVANGALEAGGEVIGVMPHALVTREAAHRGLSRLHIVNSMHERKALLAELADGFIALPGGIGTLEELFETWTWAQLGVHAKPIGLLNVAQYWSPLTGVFEQMGTEGFLRPHTRDMLIVDDDAQRLVNRMQAYVAPNVTAWISLPET